MQDDSVRSQPRNSKGRRIEKGSILCRKDGCSVCMHNDPAFENGFDIRNNPSARCRSSLPLTKPSGDYDDFLHHGALLPRRVTQVGKLDLDSHLRCANFLSVLLACHP
jgi:hypothetical protein